MKCMEHRESQDSKDPCQCYAYTVNNHKEWRELDRVASKLSRDAISPRQGWAFSDATVSLYPECTHWTTELDWGGIIFV